jgi:uncharacterized delta-60 repeat protein
VLVQPVDGKVVVAGYSFNGSDNDFALVRYNTDGSLDTSFGTGGVVLTDFGSRDQAVALVLQPDGKFVAAGFSGSDFALASYNPDGSLDTTFGSGGKVTTNLGSTIDQAWALVLQADGKLVAAGTTGDGSTDSFGLARYNANGTLDTSFGSGGIVTTRFGSSQQRATALVLQPDGKLVAAGGVNFGGGNFDFALARYNPDGSLDATFGGTGKVMVDFGNSGDDGAQALALQPDGKILAAGTVNWTSAPSAQFGLIRLNPDGSLDGTFGSGGKVLTGVGGAAGFNSLLLQADGKIIAGGSRCLTRIDCDFALARYNSDGSLDATFGNGGIVITVWGGGEDYPNGLAMQSDGKIVAAGVVNADTNSDIALVRYGVAMCVGGVPLDCDDSNVCTDDSCDPATGCVNAPNTASCNDGNACTTNDGCNGAGTCIGGPPPVCDACQTCDPTSGCTGIVCTTTPTVTPTNTPTNTPTSTPISTPTDTPTRTPTNTATNSPTQTPTATPTGSATRTPTATPTSTSTATPTWTPPCQGAPAGASCFDNVFCNGTDTCDGNGTCVHGGDPCASGLECANTCNDEADTCFDPAGTSCDDADPCTLQSSCDGAGACVGVAPPVADFAILRWPAAPPAPIRAVLGRGARSSRIPTPGLSIGSSVCADTIRMEGYTQTYGDLVAPATTGTAVSLRPGDRVMGDVITGGGAVSGLGPTVLVGGRVDTSGSAPQLGQCAAAACRVERRYAELRALPVTPGFQLAPIRQRRGATQDLNLPSGEVVIDVPRIQLGAYATLRLVGDASTQAIVRTEHLSVGYAAHIRAQGINPEQIVFVVTGSATVGAYASVSGSLLATSTIHVARAGSVDGGIFASAGIRVDGYARVNPHPFVGW